MRKVTTEDGRSIELDNSSDCVRLRVSRDDETGFQVVEIVLTKDELRELMEEV